MRLRRAIVEMKYNPSPMKSTPPVKYKWKRNRTHTTNQWSPCNKIQPRHGVVLHSPKKALETFRFRIVSIAGPKESDARDKPMVSVKHWFTGPKKNTVGRIWTTQLVDTIVSSKSVRHTK